MEFVELEKRINEYLEKKKDIPRYKNMLFFFSRREHDKNGNAIGLMSEKTFEEIFNEGYLSRCRWVNIVCEGIYKSTLYLCIETPGDRVDELKEPQISFAGPKIDWHSKKPIWLISEERIKQLEM